MSYDTTFFFFLHAFLRFCESQVEGQYNGSGLCSHFRTRSEALATSSETRLVPQNSLECPRRQPNLLCSCCAFLRVPPRFLTVIWDITTSPLQWINLNDHHGQAMDNFLSKICKFARTWAHCREYWIPLWGHHWPFFVGPWVECVHYPHNIFSTMPTLYQFNIGTCAYVRGLFFKN